MHGSVKSAGRPGGAMPDARAEGTVSRPPDMPDVMLHAKAKPSSLHIALLRLDTDTYASTPHELTALLLPSR